MTRCWRGSARLNKSGASRINLIAESSRASVCCCRSVAPIRLDVKCKKEREMTRHKTGTRDEWLSARQELLRAEKEYTRRGDELSRQRRELPWVPLEQDYRFDTENGKSSLADLFRGRSQLVVYHFMFGPDYSAGCPACSATADSFN